MILTGKMISATEALNYGLVNHICPQDQLLEACGRISSKINKTLLKQ